jgi:hypothetical protein
MNEALIVRDDRRRSIAFTQEAQAMKADALATAGLIGRVSTAEENANAVEAQKELKRVLGLCEQARKLCKEPVLDFGRSIDASAKQFSADIEREFMRVTQLVADFQSLEQERLRAAEAARRLEEEKLQREREMEERRIREAAQAEARKLADEQEAINKAAASARNAKEREEAEIRQHEIDRQKSLADARTHEQMDAAQERFNESAKALPVFEAARVKGQTVTEDWNVNVTDIHLLYRHHPNCVTLTPLLSEIKALVKAGTIPKGVRAEKVVKSTVRVAPERMAIEV